MSVLLDPIAPDGIDKRARILRLSSMLDGDELDVLILVAQGLVDGRPLYGELDAVHDKRDWLEEATQERRDLTVYLAAEVVRRRRLR